MAALLAAVVTIVTAAAPPVLTEPLAGRQVFSPANWWNLDISQAPVDAKSPQLIGWISGRTGTNTTAVRRLHPDFGPPPYGFPYVVVSGDQPRVPVVFEYADESDTGIAGLPGYPVPDEARTQANYIEGGEPGGGTSGDRHLLVIDRDRWMLYETFATTWNAALSRWEGGSGAIFDLGRSDRRPDGWTSADASGSKHFPGLVRYDEVFSAARSRTASASRRAIPTATSGRRRTRRQRQRAPPMGARLRLKASRDISGFTPEVQRIFRAFKRYGLIVVDNGSDMPSAGRWTHAGTTAC